MTDFHLIIAAGVIASAYIVLCNRLTAYVHPIRMRLADQGRDLLDSGVLAGHDEELVEAALDRAYSTWGAWAHVILMPFAAVVVTFEMLLRRPDSLDQYPKDVRDRISKFGIFSTISVMANSPLAAALLILELAILAIFFVPLGRLAHAMGVAQERLQSVLWDHHNNHNHAQ
ncbi:MAG: hypothetical protein Q7S99_09145 [Parvibaculum sp.]|nr:hypothetical protein [Parvibaculum sp.]